MHRSSLQARPYLLWTVTATLLLHTLPPAVTATSSSSNRPSVNSDHDYDRLLPSRLAPVLLTVPLSVSVVTGGSMRLHCSALRLGHHSLTWRRGSDVISVGKEGLFHSVVSYATRDVRRSVTSTGYEIDLESNDLENLQNDPELLSFLAESTSTESNYNPLSTISPSTSIPSPAPYFVSTLSSISEESTALLKNLLKKLRDTQVQNAERRTPQADLEDDLLVLLNTSTLLVDNVTFTDSGSYTCEIGPRPHHITVTHHVIVTSLPEVVAVGRSHVFPVVGSDQQLLCNASGSPPPKIDWYKTESMTSTSRLARGDVTHGGPVLLLAMDTSRLVMTNVTHRDSGHYVCVATNIVGAHAAGFTISVRHAPIVEENISPVYTGVRESAKLVCVVLGYPVPKVQWYRNENGAPVDPMRLRRARNGNRFVLQFKSVRVTDFGTYRCDASNPYGTHTGTVTLTGQPAPPQVVSESFSRESSEYTLLWEVQSHAPILHYTLTIANVTTDDSGQQVPTEDVGSHQQEEEQTGETEALPESDTSDVTTLRVPGGPFTSSYQSQKKELTDLQPDQTYSVSVTAHNEYGDNTLEYPFIFTTAPDVSDLLGHYDYFNYSSTISNYDYTDSIDYHDHHSGRTYSHHSSRGNSHATSPVTASYSPTSNRKTTPMRPMVVTTDYASHNKASIAREQQQQQQHQKTLENHQQTNKENVKQHQDQDWGEEGSGRGTNETSPPIAAGGQPAAPGFGAWLTAAVLSAFFYSSASSIDTNTFY